MWYAVAGNAFEEPCESVGIGAMGEMVLKSLHAGGEGSMAYTVRERHGACDDFCYGWYLVKC